MQLERRAWAIAALVGLLATLAVVFARPILLAGGALVGAWLLLHQAGFAADLERVRGTLSVEQSPSRTGVRTVDALSVTLKGAVDDPSPLAVSVRAGLPPAVRATGSLAISIDPGMMRASKTVPISCPVAGRHRFDPPTVRATDGWFRETLSIGRRPTITAEPPGPRSVHVGEGGDRVTGAYGDHEAGGRGSGLEPTEIREYTTGDTIDRIDWNATARLGTPHVREHDARTERPTVLVVDHRASLGVGPPGETKLAYLREAALTTVASARRAGDPIGLVTVDGRGITEHIEPASAPANYVSVRRRLLDLDPAIRLDGHSGRSPVGTGDSGDAAPTLGPATRDPSHRYHDRSAAQRAFAGADDADTFAGRLRPFYADRTRRVRLESDPLAGAVRTAHSGGRTVRTVVFTDDSSPRELRQITESVRRHDGGTAVVLAPTVLFEAGGLADLERASDRYVSFESLRRDIARGDRVTALEVCPGDGLATVLDAVRSAPATGGDRS